MYGQDGVLFATGAAIPPPTPRHSLHLAPKGPYYVGNGSLLRKHIGAGARSIEKKFSWEGGGQEKGVTYGAFFFFSSFFCVISARSSRQYLMMWTCSR